MKPGALAQVLAAAIGLIALSPPSAAMAGHAAGSTNPAAPLINHFPLGTQTLSRTTTASAAGLAMTGHGASAVTGQEAAATTQQRASATTPDRGSTATSHRHGRAQAGSTHGAHGVSSAIFLLAFPAIIIVGLLARMAIRKSRRPVLPSAGGSRPPHRIRRGVALVARMAIRRPRRPVLPSIRGRRRPRRIKRSVGASARWTYQDKDELEHKPPPLPIRPKTK